MATPVKLSYSRISAYRQCPCKHWYRYVRGIQPKAITRPLQFGRDFHALLERRWDQKAVVSYFQHIDETYAKLPSVQQEELGKDYVLDIQTIFGDYQTLYTARGQEQHVFGDAIHELEFEIPIGKLGKGEDARDVYFIGVIDEVLTSTVGDGGIVEHKTFSKKPNPIFLTMNTQIALYAKAYKMLYKKPLKRVTWDYIKSTPATEPALLKSGKLSEAATKSVTPYSYRRACQRHNLPIDKGKEEQYAYNFDEFFFRRTIDVNPAVVKDVWQGFKRTIADIMKDGHVNTTKYINQSCAWCDYRDVCTVQFDGGEIEDIIKEKYEERNADLPI